MKKTFGCGIAVLGLSFVAIAALLAFGVIDISADTPHNPAVYSVIEWVRERAIARGAADVSPPNDLSEAGRIRRGAGNYDAMCANCHLHPGVENTEIRQGLYPTPPNLGRATETDDSVGADARRFWIIKHGVKASGMPAWSNGGMEDEAIWDLVAFIKALPSLSPESYGELVKASRGHSHSGIGKHNVEERNALGAEHHHGAESHFHEHGAQTH